jgi:hypothetical protein
MMSRTQISLPPDEHRQARKRASELGVSLAEYVRRLIRQDLRAPEEPRNVHISEIFGIGDSGGSDIAAHKDEYIGDAVEAQHPR